MANSDSNASNGAGNANPSNAVGLTPNLDALAKQSLWFANAYATGNRTVRGLEALSLSLPPTWPL